MDAHIHKNKTSTLEVVDNDLKNLDDDGREKRTGSGVLSLAWAIAQLGWVVGPVVLMAFSFITYFTSTLLADAYRTPDPVSGKRNYTYMDVVRANLGGSYVHLCGLAQYANFIGATIGYTITASLSMAAVKRSNCYHSKGHAATCNASNYPYMILFAVVQIILCQIPNFHKLSWLSILAAVMSFSYSSIGLGLSLAKVIGEVGANVKTSLTGVEVGLDVTGEEKVWRTFQSIGDIAFAYTYSTVLIEIQVL
ncbi:amino acid permease 6-like [Bidens hawaiensis]|uniref:amino acid permease 6-like n=1 Tax=Bidens hawaiensis TaxID=980011 RepID=UPI00404B645F